MKSINLILVLGAIGLLAGCEKKSNSTQPPAAPPAGTGEVRNLPPAASTAPVLIGVKDSFAATTTPLGESNEQYIAVTEKKLLLLNTQIDELSRKMETLTAEAKQQVAPMLASLREQRKTTKQSFDQVKQASAEVWTELKADFETAMAELKKAYESAKSKLS